MLPKTVGSELHTARFVHATIKTEKWLEIVQRTRKKLGVNGHMRNKNKITEKREA
jgi:hypothetical protein